MLFDYAFLDVEFVMDNKGFLYCLQVRSLVTKSKINLYNLYH